MTWREDDETTASSQPPYAVRFFCFLFFVGILSADILVTSS